MNLQDYVRPRNDTGIGIHWAIGRSELSAVDLRRHWIPELKNLGVSWVKINDHREALPLIELLLAADIMPIVNIFRHRPNPGHLGAIHLTEIERLIRAGVRYFEFNQEPDRASEWSRDEIPENGLSLVAKHTAIDIEAILARGGYPAIPAVSPGSHWDILGELLNQGKEDLLEGAVWQAVHDFAGNRPPAYPQDPANLEAVPVTQEMVHALQQENYGDVWGGRSRSEVNELRREALANPVESQYRGVDDRVCWRVHEQIAARTEELLGRKLPILSTAGGYQVGEAPDPRYPMTTPLLHMAQTLEICRAMMGTSRRLEPAPSYYFCSCFWLLANQRLESDRAVDEQHAWFSEHWSERMLPIVPALRSEPKQSRKPPVIKPRERVLPPPTKAEEWYEAPSGGSILAGTVRGGAGASLCLINCSEGYALTTLARPDGQFRFVDLAAGCYSVSVQDPPGSAVYDIQLDGETPREVDLAVEGWGFLQTEEEPEEEETSLRCEVELPLSSASESPAIRLRTASRQSRVVPMVRTGTTRMRHCEIAPLASGEYRIDVIGLPETGTSSVSAAIRLAPQAQNRVRFLYSVVQPHRRRRSSLTGHLVNGADVTLQLHDEEGKIHETVAAEDGSFRFDSLPPGNYRLEIVGHESVVNRDRIAFDGRNEVEVRLELPEAGSRARREEGWSMVSGEASWLAGAPVSLVSQKNVIRRVSADAEGRFFFRRVTPGIYTLWLDRLHQPGLAIGADERVELGVPDVDRSWRADVTLLPDNEDEPEDGRIEVEILGRSDLEVLLERDGEIIDRKSVVAQEGKEGFLAYFESQMPGRYQLSVPDLEAETSFELRGAGRRAVFYRSGVLTAALQIRRRPRLDAEQESGESSSLASLEV